MSRFSAVIAKKVPPDGPSLQIWSQLLVACPRLTQEHKNGWYTHYNIAKCAQALFIVMETIFWSEKRKRC